MSWYDPSDFLPLVTIEDWDELRRRYGVLARAVRLPGDGTVRLVRREGWVAVPSEDFVAADAIRILVLCEHERRTGLWGLALHQLGWQDPQRWDVRPPGFDVPANLDGLEAFIDEVTGFRSSYALPLEDASWTIITASRDDYYVTLGKPAAVERILECPVSQGFSGFEAYAEIWRESFPATAEGLRTILTDLRDRHPRMAPGETVALHASWATWQPEAPV